jgi:hypothetical protein
MSTPSIIVEARMVGRRKPLWTDWEIPLPPEGAKGGSRTTLRDLLTRLVHEEVVAFRERQVQRRLPQLMTRTEIEAGAAHGSIKPGASEVEPQAGDEAAAVAVALQAFEDGLYYVFIDGKQEEALDREVFLGSDSRVTLIRLVALAGG